MVRKVVEERDAEQPISHLFSFSFSLAFGLLGETFLEGRKRKREEVADGDGERERGWVEVCCRWN